jgi:hypothetical protein
MKNTLTIIFLTFGLYSQGQTLRIDTLKLPLSQHFKEIQSNKMNYPLIKTGNYKIDSLINFDLKNKFTNNEYPKDNIDSTIIKWADNQIIFLDFQVTYLKTGLISLNISAEGCGAYCSNWTEYFNYSTVTGKPLSINSVVDTTGGFRKLAIEQTKTQYNKNTNELKEMLMDKSSGLDSAAYNWTLEYYNDCGKSIDFESFALYPDHLEIIETCYLPNAIKNMTPIIELKYYYKDIKKYLKIKD